jgi:hypothetical protein
MEKQPKVWCGGLWQSTDVNNNPVLSGSFTYATKLLIFKNTDKKKETDPDFKYYISQNELKENSGAKL